MFSRTYKASPGYFSFNDGFCAFSLLRKEAFDRLTQTPPVSLEQDYYRCVPRVADTFVLSFGLALSNTMGILAPTLVALFVGLLVLGQWFTGRHLPRTFSAAEKSNVLGWLATRILVQRRGVAVALAGRGGGGGGGEGGGESEGEGEGAVRSKGTGDEDHIPATLLPTVSIVAALSAELDIGAGSEPEGSGGRGGASQHIYICEAPGSDSPAGQLARLCQCNAKLPRRGQHDGDAGGSIWGGGAKSFQVDSPLPRAAAISVDSPSERL